MKVWLEIIIFYLFNFFAKEKEIFFFTQDKSSSQGQGVPSELINISSANDRNINKSIQGAAQ
jgi:hypothetical protein